MNKFQEDAPSKVLCMYYTEIKVHSKIKHLIKDHQKQ